MIYVVFLMPCINCMISWWCMASFFEPCCFRKKRLPWYIQGFLLSKQTTVVTNWWNHNFQIQQNLWIIYLLCICLEETFVTFFWCWIILYFMFEKIVSITLSKNPKCVVNKCAVGFYLLCWLSLLHAIRKCCCCFSHYVLSVQCKNLLCDVKSKY